MRSLYRGVGLILVLLPVVARADDAASESRMRRDLTYLTSDECEGRAIGTKGIDLAAEHIAREFAKAGLQPGGDRGTYFQSFPLISGTRLDKPAALTLKGPLGQMITLEMDKGFSVFRGSGTGKIESGLVFAGHGLVIPRLNYDDYRGLDVTGKVVVVLRGSPRSGNAFAPLGGPDAALDRFETSDDAKIMTAEAKKAAALVFVNDQSILSGPVGGTGGGRGFIPTQQPGDTLTPSPRAAAGRGAGGLGGPTLRGSLAHVGKIPVLQIRRVLADDMLHAAGSEPLAALEKRADATLANQGRPLPGWTATLETAVTHTFLPVKNVIGVLPGAGPLAEQTIVIGAHYDHVGLGGGGGFGGGSTFGGVGAFGSPPLRGSRMIHHGADDNASGTTCVLELARQFAALPQRQGRRLVFMAFTAEESGLLGSNYYTRRPAFPLETTLGMVNMDMVGRLQDNRLEVEGVGSAVEFSELVDRLNTRHGFTITKVASGFGGSDHTSFINRRVPALQFFTGFHEQYHMPTDRAETINIPGMAKIVGMVSDVVKEFSTREKALQYTRSTTPAYRNTALWALTTSFGVIPHASDVKGGVLVQGLIEGTPAARSGLKQGDRIVAVHGQPTDDLTSYFRIVRALPAGEKVDVLVIRGEKPTKVPVELTRLNTALAASQFGLAADPETRDALRILKVQDNSTAANAGLAPGDRLVSLAGKPVTGIDDMRHLLGKNPGDKLDLAFEHNGKVEKKTVTLTFDPTAALGRLTGGGAGANLPTALIILGAVPGVGPGEQGEGVRIGRIRAGSAAEEAGLKVDDRIVQWKGKAIKALADLIPLLSDIKAGDTFEVVVTRAGKRETIKLVMK